MSNKGISLITVVITVIVIILLATITYFSGSNSPDMAIAARFVHQMDDLNAEVGLLRVDNYKKYKDLNYGFEEVEIKNAPDDFVSTSSSSSPKKGYLLDISQIETKLDFGNGTPTVAGEVTFDTDDVYVMDADGIVYYAKGLFMGNIVYYNSTTTKIK